MLYRLFEFIEDGSMRADSTFLLLAVVMSVATSSAHEFQVTPPKVEDGQNLVFHWKIDGTPQGVPWVNIFEAGHIDNYSSNG